MMMTMMTTYVFYQESDLAHNCGRANVETQWLLIKKTNENPIFRDKANGKQSYHFALKEYSHPTNVYLILIKSRSQRSLWMFQMKGNCTLGCFSLQRLHEVCLNQKWQALKPTNEHWEGLLSNTVQPNDKLSPVIFAKLNSKVQVSKHVFCEHSVHSKATLYITYVLQVYRPPLWYSGQSS
jgi:hypothetical protein